MKLFVTDRAGNKKYLGVTSSSRGELVAKIGGQIFLLEGNVYNVNEVVAEADNSGTPAGLVIGGMLGALTGGSGLVIGALVGGLIGNNNDATDKQRVASFNNSRL